MVLKVAAGALDHAFGNRYFPSASINKRAAQQGLASEGVVLRYGAEAVFCRPMVGLLVGGLLHSSQSR